MNDKFNCIQCGKCCSKIRGMISDSDKEFLQEYAYGKMPLIQLVPIEEMSFPLYDWEATRFKKWANEKGVNARVKESRVILDLDSGKAIVATYFMDFDSCPFLDSNKCKIYDKYRAFICRMFPFNRGLFLNVDEKPSKDNLFGTCPGVKDVVKNFPDDNFTDYLNGAFPNGEFLNSIQNDMVTEWLNKTIIDLMKQKKIRPAMNMPYKFLQKRISNAEKIDFTDFLVESGFNSREEIDKMIDGYDNNLDAIDKII